MLRQDYGRLLSDSLLLAALTGIAWWDWRHLTIDIRLIALTALLQSGWSVLFVPASTIELLLGGVFGAGGLYWLGMLYAAVRGIEGLGEGDPAVLGAVLDFLANHEPDLIACAEALETEPAQLIHAAKVLNS